MQEEQFIVRTITSDVVPEFRAKFKRPPKTMRELEPIFSTAQYSEHFKRLMRMRSPELAWRDTTPGKWVIQISFPTGDKFEKPILY